MTLPASGQIDHNQIQVEFGGSNPISMSEYYGMGVSLPASGTIAMSDFHGEEIPTFTFNRTISADRTTIYDIRAEAVTAGWNQSDKLNSTITVNSGVIMRTIQTGTTFPAGSTLKIVNNGSIYGKGGYGGKPGTVRGQAGGDAIIATAAITVDNNATIAGGGSGGGMETDSTGGVNGSSGGGGRGKSGGGVTANPTAGGTNPTAGTTSAGGNGGITNSSTYFGGNGGGLGSKGSVGSGSGIFSYSAQRAGYATSGISNITWQSTGTRIGSLN